MKHLYALCKQMMDVSDEEIEAYRNEREQIEKSMTDDEEDADSLNNEIFQKQKTIDELKSTLKL